MRLFTTLASRLLGCVIAFTFSFFQHAYAQSKSLPYSTGFNNAAEQNDWKQYQLGSTAYGKFGYAQYNTASFFLYRDYPVGNDSGKAVEDWVVSPPINVTGKSLISLKKQLYVIYKVQPSDYFGIWYSTKSGDPSKGDFKELVNMTDQASTSSSWRDTSNIALNDSGSAVYIAFKYKETNNWYTIGIDSFVVKAMHGSGIETGAENNMSVSFYPNPATGIISLAYHNDIDMDNARLDIFDINGRLCRSVTCIRNSEPVSLTLPAGLYSYRLMNIQGQSATGRFIMQ